MNRLLIHATMCMNLNGIRLRSEIELMREIHYTIVGLKMEAVPWKAPENDLKLPDSKPWMTARNHTGTSV